MTSSHQYQHKDTATHSKDCIDTPVGNGYWGQTGSSTTK